MTCLLKGKSFCQFLLSYLHLHLSYLTSLKGRSHPLQKTFKLDTLMMPHFSCSKCFTLKVNINCQYQWRFFMAHKRVDVVSVTFFSTSKHFLPLKNSKAFKNQSLRVLHFPRLLSVLCNGADGHLFTAVNSFNVFYG